MSYLSTLAASCSVPAECHRSESGCTGLSVPWRCGPSGSGRSLHTEQEQKRHTHKSSDVVPVSCCELLDSSDKLLAKKDEG